MSTELEDLSTLESLDLEFPETGTSGNSGNEPQLEGARGEAEGSTATQPAEDVRAYVEKIKDLEEKLSRFKTLEPLAEALESNPHLIHDIRASLVGRLSSQPPSASTQPHPSTPQPAVAPAGVPDLDKLSEALMPLFAQDPVKASLAIAQMVARAEAERAASEAATPVSHLVTSLAIQNFKSEMSSHPFYKLVAPVFDEMVSQIPRDQFRGKDDAQIRQILSSTWYAAQGVAVQRAYEKALKEGKITVDGGATPAPPNYGGGRGASAPSGRSKLTREQLLLAKMAGLTQKDIEELEAEEE